MQEQEITPSDITFTLVLTACAKIGSSAFSVGQVSVQTDIFQINGSLLTGNNILECSPADREKWGSNIQ